MKTILDLCGGTGSWSQPYRDAGYDVQVIDPASQVGGYLTDVRLLEYRNIQSPVHGILAAPPCTHLCSSGARWWKRKGTGALFNALSIVDACLRLVVLTQPRWWAMENPVGRLARFLGPPAYWFHPYEYGDPWYKKTGMWGAHIRPPAGDYSPPPKQVVEDRHNRGTIDPEWIHKCAPGPKRSQLRSMTPPGFARAFFEANP
jgi:hypothetical protein